MQSASGQVMSKVSAFRWLILVALAWFQLSVAAHQFGHASTDVGETCAVCLQADRDGEALADTSGTDSRLTTNHTEFAVATFSDVTERFTLFRARASP